MMTPIRFGLIHIISPEKRAALRIYAEQSVPPGDTTRKYIQALAEAIHDEAVLHPGEYLVQDMKDGRRVILSNSDTADFRKYTQYQQKRLAATRKAGERIPWDKPRWVDEFITERSGQGARLNFVEEAE
jgi:hypothetical protein